MQKNIVFTLILFLVAPQVIGEMPTPGDDDHLNIQIIGPHTEKIEVDVYSAIRYVSTSSGKDIRGHGQKNKPWKTLQFALLQIQDASDTKRYALFVATGSYHRTPLHLKSYIDLFGGFSEQDWQRDIWKHKTILDARRKSRVVLAADATRIDGFIIRDGAVRDHGGGIFCEDVSPVISNNIITSNFVEEPVNFNTTRIHQNGHHGGGIACLYNAVPVIRNNLIVNNKTGIGCGAGIAFYGWLRMENAPPTQIQNNVLVGGLRAVVENNVIIDNLAGIHDSSRTRSSSGGGISCAHEARALIRNNIISGNQALGRSDAGGIYSEYYSYPEILGNWIVGNTCDDDGGGIYIMRQGQPLLMKNIIAGNRTTGGGIGGIRISKEGRARIIDNEISYNPGGGVMCVDSYMELIGNRIMFNPGGLGVVFKTNFSYMQPSMVRNNHILDNEQGAVSTQENSKQYIVLKDNNTKNMIDPGSRGSIKGRIHSIEFDAKYFVSRIKINNKIPDPASLAGRVIRINDKWGVIKEGTANALMAWGDLRDDSDQAQNFYIIPTYERRK
jgi:hypothetical protein